VDEWEYILSKLLLKVKDPSKLRILKELGKEFIMAISLKE
jgi:hypothetical protein